MTLTAAITTSTPKTATTTATAAQALTNINNSDQQQQHNGVDNHDFIREKMDATENCIALTKVRSIDDHDDTCLMIESCSNGFTL